MGGRDWDAAESTRDAPFLYPEAIPTLVSLLTTDMESDVRSSAAFKLGHIADTTTIPALIQAASDASEDVRYGVAYALGSFGESAWDRVATYKESTGNTLLKLMDDEDEDVRDWATFGIHQGEHDTPETRAQLWKALDDDNYDVRGEAAVALAKFGDRTLVPRLDKLLQDEDELSPLFFEAAEILQEPSLLPAVLQAAEVWKSWDENREMHRCIRSAIEALQKIASQQNEAIAETSSQ